MKFPLYFDYAATTPVHPDVLEALLPYLKENFGNSGSSHHLYGWKASEAIDEARKIIASYFGLTPSSLIFTSGATESTNLAIQGFLDNSEKGHLITSKIEHKAVLDVFHRYEQLGWEVTYLDPDPNGEIPVANIQSFIRPNTRLISLMWVNNEIGTVLDIEAVAKLSVENSIVFHSDMTQGLGKLELKTQFLPDLMSFSGHKMYAPKGIGALVVKNQSIKLSPLVFGGKQERGLRPGTLPTYLIVAFAKSFQLIPSFLAKQAQYASWRVQILERLKKELEDRIVINAEIATCLPQIIHFSVPHVDWEELFRSLSKLALSNGSACNVKSQLPSHVMMALGHHSSTALASIRLSFGLDTTQDEIDFACQYLVEQIKQMS
ncbi:cysteine desulfurase family protein [Aquirufa sp. ROCK2-A2]